MNPWTVAAIVALGLLVLALACSVRPAPTAVERHDACVPGAEGIAPWRVASALRDAAHDPEAAATKLRATEEWRAQHADFSGACSVDTMGVLRDLVEPGVLDVEHNSELGVDVPGRFVLLDLERWHAVGVSAVPVPVVARAALCCVERAVRADLGVALVVRPCWQTFDSAKAVLETVLDVMRQRYGGTLVSVWVLPCGWAVRGLLRLGRAYVPQHVRLSALSPGDVEARRFKGVALGPAQQRMVAAVMGDAPPSQV